MLRVGEDDAVDEHEAVGEADVDNDNVTSADLVSESETLMLWERLELKRTVAVSDKVCEKLWEEEKLLLELFEADVLNDGLPDMEGEEL